MVSTVYGTKVSQVWTPIFGAKMGANAHVTKSFFFFFWTRDIALKEKPRSRWYITNESRQPTNIFGGELAPVQARLTKGDRNVAPKKRFPRRTQFYVIRGSFDSCC